MKVTENAGTWVFEKMHFLLTWFFAILFVAGVAIYTFLKNVDWKKLNQTVWRYIDIPAKYLVVR